MIRKILCGAGALGTSLVAATAAYAQEATQAATEAAVATEEATAAATETPAEEATPAEASTEAPEAVATETPGDLPGTGIDLASGGTTLPVVAVVLALLVIGGFATRRKES